MLFLNFTNFLIDEMVRSNWIWGDAEEFKSSWRNVDLKKYPIRQLSEHVGRFITGLYWAKEVEEEHPEHPECLAYIGTYRELLKRHYKEIRRRTFKRLC